jgi:hypothetical protein
LVQLIQAGHDQLSGRLSDLLGDMQILDAKLHDLAQQDDDFSSLRIHTARGYLIDVAIVSERVSAFFEYGRRRSELVPRPPTWAAVTGALNLLGFDKDQNPDLMPSSMGVTQARSRWGQWKGWGRLSCLQALALQLVALDVTHRGTCPARQPEHNIEISSEISAGRPWRAR